MVAGFIVTLLKKWGIVDRIQVRGNKFFSKMFSCDFCLSWWSGVIVSIAYSIITGEPVYLFIPFCSTMITRYIL